jgi:hypothetical protein
MPQEENTNPTQDEAINTPATGGSSGEKPNQGSNPQEETIKEGDVKSLPEWARIALATARREAQERRLELEKRDREEQTKAKDELKAKEQWQTIAQQQEQEIAALKPKADAATTLNELLTARINAEIADWPEELKGTAPEGEVTALEMVKWVDKMRPLADRLKVATTPKETPKPKGGNPPGPTPGGKAGDPSGPSDPDEAGELVDLSQRF